MRQLFCWALILLGGAWGVPWGPILTARAVWVNLSGVDTTAQVLAHLGESAHGPR